MSEGLKWTTPNALLDEDADVAKIQVSLAKIVTPRIAIAKIFVAKKRRREEASFYRRATSRSR